MLQLSCVQQLKLRKWIKGLISLNSYDSSFIFSDGRITWGLISGDQLRLAFRCCNYSIKRNVNYYYFDFVDCLDGSLRCD